MVDSDRQRTKVVQRGDADVAGVHGLDDSWKQTKADAMAQLGIFEAKIANLPKHGATLGVAM